jgi:hypothetical protein
MNKENPADKTARECRKILDRNRQCPPADMLVSFREDELVPQDSAAVAAHLGSCPECARLIERLEEAEGPMAMAEDHACRAARDEDRAHVARALGFRVGRPPARPLSERLSRLWEIRVPALVPAAVCAVLLAVILLPGPGQLPVTVFPESRVIQSDDAKYRSATEQTTVPVNASLVVRHMFNNTDVEVETMANIEISSAKETEYFDPVSVIEIEDGETTYRCLEVQLAFHAPGQYQLRLSHPKNAFDPVILKFNALAP